MSLTGKDNKRNACALPIGGAHATDNLVIPYAAGVDMVVAAHPFTAKNRILFVSEEIGASLDGRADSLRPFSVLSGRR